MEVIKPGSKVLIAGNVDATILTVSIRHDSVSYEVVWWSGLTRTTAWLEPFEITIGELTPLLIGFMGR